MVVFLFLPSYSVARLSGIIVSTSISLPSTYLCTGRQSVRIEGTDRVTCRLVGVRRLYGAGVDFGDRGKAGGRVGGSV